MKNKKRIFNILTILFVIILITWFTEINYQDLSFGANKSAYLGITSAILLIFAMQLTKRNQK